MKSLHRILIAALAGSLLMLTTGHAQEASSSSTNISLSSSSDSDSDSTPHRLSSRRRSNNDQVAIGGNAELPAGEKGHAVVAIMGNATAAGEVSDSVVAIMGNTRVTGPVDNAVVTIVGNSYVNSHVGRDVVTIMGNLELGPDAVVDGQLVNIGGTLSQDPSAVTHGERVLGAMPFNMKFGWLHDWVTKCLFTGRLLAFDAGLMWAWYVALISLLLYVLTAAMVPHTVARCVDTLETYPGRSLLAALVSIPLTPICLFLMVITLVGILLIPFFGLALLTIAWFGKLVLLAWIGKRLLQAFGAAQPSWAWAVLLGGIVATLLYTIPIIGLLSYKLLQFIGFGAVLYVLVLMFQRPKAQHASVNKAGDFTADAPPSPANGTSGPSPSSDASDSVAKSSVEVGAPHAGFWIRMGALAIDVILIGVVCNVIPFGLLNHSWLLALAIYGAVMWKLKGTTVGGIVFHLQVVRSDGKPLDWATCIVRALSCFLSLAVMGLGFIWIGIDAKQQGWHDKLAGTVVIRTPEGQPLI